MADCPGSTRTGIQPSPLAAAAMFAADQKGEACEHILLADSISPSRHFADGLGQGLVVSGRNVGSGSSSPAGCVDPSRQRESGSAERQPGGAGDECHRRKHRDPSPAGPGRVDGGLGGRSTLVAYDFHGVPPFIFDRRTVLALSQGDRGSCTSIGAAAPRLERVSRIFARPWGARTAVPLLSLSGGGTRSIRPRRASARPWPRRHSWKN